MIHPELSTHLSRRHFLQSCSAAIGLGAAPSVLGAVKGISSRIHIGVIGLGARGSYLLKTFLNHPEVQVRAVCDADRYHYRANSWGQGPALGREPARKIVESFYAQRAARERYQGCLVFEDYRSLCQREDIDAVVVATPDHWHYHR